MGDESGDWGVTYPYRHSCSYCGTILEVCMTEVRVYYEVPIIPPPGARDLGLKSTERRFAGSIYKHCPRCGNKHYEEHVGSRGEGGWPEYSRREARVERVWEGDAFAKALIESVKKAIPASARIIGTEAKRYRPNPNYRSGQTGDCFIATAVYGSPNASEVQTLRKFRDDFLLKSYFGRIFVSFYYSVSPFLAHCLEHRKKMKSCVRRIFLGPLVNLISSLIFRSR